MVDMATRTRDWAWRRLAETGGKVTPTNYRRPDYIKNAQGRTVRQHAPHPTTPALERFEALTLRKFNGEDYCIVFRGGDTFRVDLETVTTPARFYWEATHGEKLAKADVLKRDCKTPRCVKHRRKA